MIPAVAYLRMSDLSQDTSIAQQRQQVTAFAKKEKYDVLEWYVDEGKSGSHSVEKRTAFLKMLADLQKDDSTAQAVLCLDISRFGRLDTIEGAFAKKKLRDAGIYLHTKMEGKTDWRQQVDRIVDAVLTEAQHDYSFRLGQKTLRGKLNAFERDGFFGFKVPFGFAREVTDEQGSKRIIGRTEKFSRPKNWSTAVVLGDPDEIAVVRWMYQQFETRDVGYRFLAAELNAKKTPSPTGKLWTAKVISELLSNKKYAGDLSLGDSASGQFWQLEADEVVRADGVDPRKRVALLKRDAIPAIISREQFDRVQKKIARRKESGTHSEKSGGYLLKDVLYCGHCGRALYGNPNRSGKKTGKVQYVCKTAVTYGKQGTCGQWSVKEEDVLPFLQREAVAAIDKEAARRAAVDLSKPKKNVAGTEKRIAELSKKIESGTERFLTAPVELTAEIAATLNQWKAERHELLEQVAAATKAEAGDLLTFKTEKLKQLREQLIHVTTGAALDGKYSSGVYVFRDTFRQLLIDAGVRVDFWWERASTHRWRIGKVRLRIGNATQDVTGASLMVWCGERKGRCSRSGCEGSSRPQALQIRVACRLSSGDRSGRMVPSRWARSVLPVPGLPIINR